jgi:hypothetical protein
MPPTRVETLDELFTDDEAVDGVIHVVCNGFVSIREPDAQRVLRDDFERLVVLAEGLHDKKELVRRRLESYD